MMMMLLLRFIFEEEIDCGFHCPSFSFSFLGTHTHNKVNQQYSLWILSHTVRR